MLLVKCLLNSTISTKGAKFMTADISNFYLMTPLKRFEYIRLKLSDIPEEIIEEYQLRDKADKDDNVYVEVRRGMYGLPQSGLLSQELLEKRLEEHGYYQSKIIHGFWKHKWRPICFSLVVDDFGVKYVGKEHAEHLLSVLRENYKVKEDWTGSRYIGIFMDWDYDNQQVHLYIPDYIQPALKQFGHETPSKRQDSPYPHTAPKYGATKQYATPVDNSTPLDKEGKKFIQQVNGKFLFYGRAVDPILLTPLSALASQQAAPTVETMKRVKQFLS